MAGTIVDKSLYSIYLIAGNKGYESTDLKYFSATNPPAIAAGSHIEVNGELYTFSSDDLVQGAGSYGDGVSLYIKFVSSGSDLTPTFTNVAPTWSSSKQGWYSGNDRYLFSVYKVSSTEYNSKKKLLPQGNIRFPNNVDVDGDFAVSGDVSGANGVYSGDVSGVNGSFTGELTGASIETDNVAIKHKLFTGTLDSNGFAIFTHGVDYNKILSVSCYYLISGSWTNLNITAGSDIYTLQEINSTTITCYGYSTLAGYNYRCLITYEA